MSSGNSKQSDTDLEKYKKFPQGSCKFLNMQQLPSDKITRSCFVAQKGNLFCSCDYSAQLIGHSFVETLKNKCVKFKESKDTNPEPNLYKMYTKEGAETIIHYLNTNFSTW